LIIKNFDDEKIINVLTQVSLTKEKTNENG
jgi:hypothetical protein